MSCCVSVGESVSVCGNGGVSVGACGSVSGGCGVSDVSESLFAVGAAVGESVVIVWLLVSEAVNAAYGVLVCAVVV